jgi:hypothetical protein
MKRREARRSRMGGQVRRDSDEIGMLRGVVLAEMHKYDSFKSTPN